MYYSNWLINKEVIGVGIKMLQKSEKNTSRNETEFKAEEANGNSISSLHILTYYLWFRESILTLRWEVGDIFYE